MSKLRFGGCLCGAVRYQTTGEALRVVNCHCSMCRKHSGAAYLTYVAYATDRVTVLQGNIVKYISSVDAQRSHCHVCGSPLEFKFVHEPDLIWLTLGSFDEPGCFVPAENWYVADKIDWIDLNEAQDQWPGAPGA